MLAAWGRAIGFIAPPRRRTSSESPFGRSALELVAFTIVGIGLYLAADAALRHLERGRGAPFENRSVIFFAILLALAITSFALIRALVGA